MFECIAGLPRRPDRVRRRCLHGNRRHHGTYQLRTRRSRHRIRTHGKGPFTLTGNKRDSYVVNKRFLRSDSQGVIQTESQYISHIEKKNLLHRRNSSKTRI